MERMVGRATTGRCAWSLGRMCSCVKPWKCRIDSSRSNAETRAAMPSLSVSFLSRWQLNSLASPISTTSPASATVNPKLLEQVFEELQLKPIQEIVGGVRVRQHVNPLKAPLMAPLAPVQWEAVFADSSLPLTVDIGCGSGRFLMVLAKRSGGSQNFLGLDVREKLLVRATQWAQELKFNNLHFVTANATVALESLLLNYPGKLVFVSVLCPDPHFKRRHQKRKIVQKMLVDVIIHYLKPGGIVFVQSDVKDVASDMRAQFNECLGSSLVIAEGDDGHLLNRDLEGWVEDNPLGVPTEREAHVLSNGGRLYRALYRRI